MPVVMYRAWAKDRFGVTVAKAWTFDGENAFGSFYIRIGIWFNRLINTVKTLF
ncbi:MAG: hypothetical protein K6G90_05975 [Clostridia bacterium]|nr:hypothetical protein [Clostridia bacterium]